GSYALVSRLGIPLLALRPEPIPNIPRDRISGNASGVSSPILASPDLARKSRFRDRLLQRDNHCPITKFYKDVKASHFIAHSWWRPVEGRRGKLPQDIYDAIARLEDEIDCIQNGLLLSGELASAMDRGEIGFYYVGTEMFCLALSFDYLKHDGVKLDYNTRLRADGHPWWNERTRPLECLVDFHLRQSVFRNCRGAALETSDDRSEDEEDAPVEVQVKLAFLRGLENMRPSSSGKCRYP
ncbi:hypothetical protein HK405_015783, partial [Cladochytrium tenue]